MSIPSILQQKVESAQIAMRKHPQHDLGLGHRLAIYASLGPRADSPDATDLRGYKRRTMLEVITVRYLLPSWEQVRPGDETVYQVLEEVQQLMDNKVTISSAKRNLQKWTARLANLPTQSQVILQSALTALSTAIADQDFNLEQIDYDLSDEDDYDEGQAYRDAAGWGAHFHAGGGIWDESSSAIKRREFWEWWLKEAIPAAWNVSYQSDP